MSTIVIAPDSFKGSASATDVARALAAGWRDVRSGDELVLAPMADGGEGTIEAFAAAYPGSRHMPVQVTGPDDRLVSTSWLLLPDGTGLVELAATSGITLLDRLRPLTAHTGGFGEAIRDALDHGVSRLLLAIGGSASTDGGAGALTALGARFLDAEGDPVPAGGGGLARLASVDLSALRPLPSDGALILSDVTSPLLGPGGAAAVFGPQKGATPDDIVVLEAGLARFASFGLLSGTPDGASGADTAGAGAAGGTGYGLLLWGARLAAGAAAVGEALQLPSRVASADLLITGEGRFDAQSLAGKVPSYLLPLARAAAVRAALVAGSVELAGDLFDRVVSLTSLAGSPASSMAEPLVWLRQAGRELATWFHGSSTR